MVPRSSSSRPGAPLPGQLSRRERQIMDVLFEHGALAAADVRSAMPDAPSYSAVRALLAKLEEKGHATHAQDGPRYVYRPVAAKSEARAGALARLLRTFFDGSVPAAVAGLLGQQREALTDAELDELEALVREARRERRDGDS